MLLNLEKPPEKHQPTDDDPITRMERPREIILKIGQLKRHHEASSSRSNKKKKKEEKQRERQSRWTDREREEDGERYGEARTARVWSINHGVFPATGGHRGRWRGHIIGRIVPVCWSAGRTVIYLVAIDRASTARLDSS